MMGIRQSTIVVLVEAANAAGFAPSIHNTQPWRWRVLPDRLQLFADRSRQLTATDPDGRMLTLSCGAALEFARLGLAAEGWSAQVRYLPDPARPDLLAELILGERVRAAPELLRTAQAMRLRRTDRRPVSDTPIPAAARAAMTRAAGDLARLHMLTGDQVIELAAAAHRAARIEAADPGIRAELAYWTSRSAPAGTGIPRETVPARQPETTVPARDFGTAGTLPIGPGHDRQARYVVLYGEADEPASWLRAGGALGAVWLAATRAGVSVVPLSGVIEVTTTREALRGMLAGLGHPYLVMRWGVHDDTAAGPPQTPRLPASQTVDRGAVGG